MKKSIILIMLLVSIVFLVSCTQNEIDRGINESLIELTKKIEVLDHKFSNFRLTYDEYIDNMNNLVSNLEEEMHYNRSYVAKPLDLRIIEEDELNSIRKEQEQNVNVEISEVYNYNNLKYIFTKSTVTPKGNSEIDNGIIITKRYSFMKEDDKSWILTSIDMRIYEKDSQKKDEDMEFNKFNNEVVEYKYLLNPFEL